MDVAQQEAEEGFLEIGGATLAWRRVGPAPAAAPTLVLLHEALGSVGSWRAFPEALAAATGLGVFLYSREGYGQSSPLREPIPRAKDYLHREALEVLPAVLEAIGFARGLVVGHSDGATIAALHAALQRPRAGDPRVSGYVLLAPHFFVEEKALAGIARAVAAYREGDLAARLRRHLGANTETAFRAWSETWSSPAFRDWDIRAEMAGIESPVLLIQGAEDEYATLEQVTALQESIGGPLETLVIPGCRHQPQREAEETVISAIAGFAGRLGLTPTSIR